MTRKRIIFLVALSSLPIAFMVGVGFYHLWKTDWLFWVWWPMAACFATAYLLAWRWQKNMRRQVADEPSPEHYTERDELAREKIKERIRNTDVTIDKLSELHLYVDTAEQMAKELALVYHPEARDYYGKLTLPEVLAVVELASHDLGEMAQTYLPAGHLMTIDNFRRANQAVKWYGRASKGFWAASALIDPIRTGIRYVAAQAGLGKPMDMVKENVALWLYAKYIERLGHYLIELYSGRLRIGVKRYRELQSQQDEGTPVGKVGTIVLDGGKSSEARAVTIAVIGQVKAGKSSLINALLGDRRAVTDVIPATSNISRYELRAPGNASKLILLDTVGYNQSGAKADQFEDTVEAAQQADLIFLVTHARNPGRNADVELWKDMKAWFRDRPELKMPPVLLVLTHVDLLSPAMEWSPPYDWRRPARPKEKNIAEAAQVTLEQFGEGIAAIVPVCAAEGRVFGIKEELLPEMTGLLGEARAVAFIRCLEAEADERQIQKVFEQLWSAGKLLLMSAMKR